MNLKERGWLLWFQLWVELVVGTVLILSIFSAFSMMRTGGWAALVGGFIWGIFRVRQSGWGPRYLSFQNHWPFGLLALCCLISLVAGPHDFLDSFSYRLPQMLLWLQEGHPWSVPNVDMRINQMPHVWSYISTVFFLPLHAWGVAIPNFISYLLLYGVLLKFATAPDKQQEKTKWILIVFMASPVMVMQAASNDNVLTCVTLLMISAYFALLQKPTTSTVAYSALAFALCCGIKPQYVTLAPLWLVWFLWGDMAPYRTISWLALSWLAPIIIICSPLPTFAINHILYGSLSNPVVTEVGAVSENDNMIEAVSIADSEKSELLSKSIHSYVSLANQMMALPINPLAGTINRFLATAAEKYAVCRSLDCANQRSYPILIPEKASLSFFASIALIGGLLLNRGAKRPYVFLCWGSLLAVLAAIQLTTPDTLGRSFVGFFLLMLPLGFVGLLRLPVRYLKMWGVLALFFGILTIVINPAQPLWPVKVLTENLSSQGIKNQLVQYSMFSHRHESGNGLVEAIPSPEKRIGAIVYGGTPTVEFWKPYRLKRNVKFYSPSVSRQRLRNDGIAYLLIKHPNLTFPSDEFLKNIDGIVEKTAFYTSYMQKGDEPWYLIKINP